MNRPDERHVVTQLIKAYEEEARLYDSVEQVAVEQNLVLRNGGDHERLSKLLDRQRELAEHIGKIESGIAPLREHWERIREAARGTQVQELARTLDRLLEDLAERIGVIVEIEKQTSRELLGSPIQERGLA